MESIRRPIYKCPICGNVVELLISGAGELICCSKPMVLMLPNSDDSASNEKHLPVIESGTNNTSIVRVGSSAHPMTPEHFIEWIEIINGNYINRKFLTPDSEPMAEFYVPNKSGIYIRAYCNKHGLWESKK